MLTAELTGALLDYWVAQGEGICLHDAPHSKSCGNWGTDYTCTRCGKDPLTRPTVETWNPSNNWEQAGPIIERENIQLGPPTQSVHRHGGPNAGWGASGMWSACTWHKGVNGKRSIAHHETSPLVAAMRCYVISKFGSEVPGEPVAAPKLGEQEGGNSHE